MKSVLVIASGATEREALPALVRHLEQEIVLADILISGSQDLRPARAEQITRAAWYQFRGAGAALHKVVVLVDADGVAPESVLDRWRGFQQRLPEVEVPILVTAAKWHLEAWFFADRKNLEAFLERTVGAVDTNCADDIENPKLRLKHLLGEVPYTSRTAGDIAARIDARVVAQRSPSFREFVRSLRNGPA